MRLQKLHLLALPVIVLASLITATAVASYSPADELVRRGHSAPFVPGQAIVRFEKGIAAGERKAARSAAGVGFKESMVLSRTQVVTVKGSVRDAVKRLERQPGVAYAQPDYRYRKMAVPPNDTRFGELWGLSNTGQTIQGNTGSAGIDVKALSAWDATRGGGATIAVVDSGVDKFHPDIAPNRLAVGHDYIDNDSDADDFEFHGTHVAGTAAAVDSNGSGIAGVAPDASIMPVRSLDGDGGGSSSTIANGIAFAAGNGADVINLSLGGAGSSDPAMSNAVDLANANDAVVVAAAGNESSNNDGGFPVVPCNLPQPNLICVAAIDNDGSLSSFSNFGTTSVDVGAPGGSVLSTKTDYDNQLPNPNFDGGTPLANWTASGTPTWGTTTTLFTSTPRSATDSPGANYPNMADGLLTSDSVSFAGRVGCRFDFMGAFAIMSGGADFFDHFAESGGVEIPVFEERGFQGTTVGQFIPIETSISAFDGDASVNANFNLLSDASGVADGAYADDVLLGCRPSSVVTEANDYHYLDGTSMASPHVAGVAALVRARDPGAPDTQIVQAIKESVDPLPSLTSTTVTGGLVNAANAIARALALPNPVAGGGAGVSVVARPSAANLRSAKSRIRVSRAGRFSYSFRAQRGIAGSSLFRTRKKAVVSRRAHVTVARKSFRTPSNGRVTLRIKLSRKNLRILRRNRRFSLRVTVTLRNSAGTSTARKNLTLLAPKRR